MAELVIIEQPSKSFRYRYVTELNGTHGHIEGENSTRNTKTMPRVQIRNCPLQKACIRCTLVTAEKDNPHPNLLVRKSKNGMDYEPHYAIVNESKNWTAEFRVGIIQTRKSDAKKVLKEKYEQLWEDKEENKSKTLTQKQKCEIEILSKEKVDLNTVRLRFEAFDVHLHPLLDKFGKPLVTISNPIANSKCANNSELVITMFSRSRGSCMGGDKVMLFVNKVDQKNIEVKFFEEDKNGDVVWEEKGAYLEVHHQFGIAFNTPPYKDENISTDAVVFYQLVRPKDGATSEAVEFSYHPVEEVPVKKIKLQPKTEPDNFSLDEKPSSSTNFEDILTTIKVEDVSEIYDSS